jgi:hypothetical protein
MENFLNRIKNDIINNDISILKDGDNFDIIYYNDIKLTNEFGIFINDDYTETYNELVNEFIMGNVDINRLTINGQELSYKQQTVIFLMILTIYIYNKSKKRFQTDLLTNVIKKIMYEQKFFV